nr:hypothetical protein Itr_chr06CG18330 [Ipomoea trifida]
MKEYQAAANRLDRTKVGGEAVAPTVGKEERPPPSASSQATACHCCCIVPPPLSNVHYIRGTGMKDHHRCPLLPSPSPARWKNRGEWRNSLSDDHRCYGFAGGESWPDLATGRESPLSPSVAHRCSCSITWNRGKVVASATSCVANGVRALAVRCQGRGS